MNLLDIIIFSLKIFALTSLIVVSISYFIFKLKDRTRVKPYMQSPIIETSGTVLNIEEKPAEISSQRFKILNPISKPQTNKYNRVERPVVINNFISQPIRNIKEEEEEQKIFNIYRHYSKNAIEPMHKIKF